MFPDWRRYFSTHIPVRAGPCEANQRQTQKNQSTDSLKQSRNKYPSLTSIGANFFKHIITKVVFRFGNQTKNFVVPNIPLFPLFDPTLPWMTIKGLNTNLNSTEFTPHERGKLIQYSIALKIFYTYDKNYINYKETSIYPC